MTRGVGVRGRVESEAGSVTLPVLTVMCCLLLVGSALGVAAAAFVDHRRAQSAADLGALAGAAALQSGLDACTQAAVIVQANRADVTSCTVEGEDVLVGVVVQGPALQGWLLNPSASARAGPTDTAAG